MRREMREQVGSHGEAEAVAEAPQAQAQAQFSSAGAIPPVAEFGTPEATASERAFGAGDVTSRLPPELSAVIEEASAEELAALLDTHSAIAEPIIAAATQLRGHGFVKQASVTRMHKPAAPSGDQQQQTEHPPIAPKPQEMPKDPARAKHWLRSKRAAFDQLSRGAPDDRSTLTEVRLPDNVVKQLDQTWKDSFVGGRQREQGGILVRKGSDYNLRREEHNESPNHFETDERPKWREDLVAQVHTHPYAKHEVPEGFATFSDADFDSLMRSDANMSMLRSGPFTFMLVKTKQFNKLVDRTGNDEDKLKEIGKAMASVYQAAFDATKGPFSQKCESGVLAVCTQFHLLYFVGEGADLVRKDKQRS